MERYIDEDELKECDETITRIAGDMEPRAYSSREFIETLGDCLEKKNTYPNYSNYF